MAKINTYSAKGNKTTAVTAPKELVGKVNKPLLAQAIRVYKDRLHGGLSKVQTRGEITSISTRKIYKQKGTGGARHGAKSAPIFVGGGVAHGPKGVKKVLSLSSAMKKKALESALSLKLKNDRIAIVKGIGNIAKTKEASDLVLSVRKDLVSKKDSRVSIVISENSKAVVRSFRNIKNVNIYRYSDLNAYRVYFGGMILMDDAIFTKKKVKTNTKT